jgi:hypothetical protein
MISNEKKYLSIEKTISYPKCIVVKIKKFHEIESLGYNCVFFIQ